MAGDGCEEELSTTRALVLIDELLAKVAGKRGKACMDGTTSSAEVPKKKGGAAATDAEGGCGADVRPARPRRASAGAIGAAAKLRNERGGLSIQQIESKVAEYGGLCWWCGAAEAAQQGAVGGSQGARRRARLLLLEKTRSRRATSRWCARKTCDGMHRRSM